MTIMQDTNGDEHEVHAAGNIARLQAIGWTVVPAQPVGPTNADEWDAIYAGRPVVTHNAFQPMARTAPATRFYP